MGLVLGVHSLGGVWDRILNCLGVDIALCYFSLVGGGIVVREKWSHGHHVF